MTILDKSNKDIIDCTYNIHVNRVYKWIYAPGITRYVYHINYNGIFR